MGSGIAKTNAVGAPECAEAQKAEGRPDMTAIYCFPFTS